MIGGLGTCKCALNQINPQIAEFLHGTATVASI